MKTEQWVKDGEGRYAGSQGSDSTDESRQCKRRQRWQGRWAARAPPVRTLTRSWLRGGRRVAEASVPSSPAVRSRPSIFLRLSARPDAGLADLRRVVEGSGQRELVRRSELEHRRGTDLVAER